MRSLSFGCVAFLALLRAADAEACEITAPSPTSTLPTQPMGQTFSFVATNDCGTLSFTANRGAITKAPRRDGVIGRDRRRFAVALTVAEWNAVARSTADVFTWTVSGRDAGGAVVRVTTINQLDFDRDGWSRTEGDTGMCDLAARRNPGEPDVCDNGVDDDCNGVVDDCGADAPNLTIRASEPVAQLGLADNVGVGDVDGDGVADLALSTLYASSGRGAIYFVYGPGGSGVVDVETLTAITSGTTWIGRSVSVGDLDGDGIDDVLSPSGNDRAYLFLGPIDSNRRAMDADAILVSAASSNPVLDIADIADDLDGDGASDVAVGARYGGSATEGYAYVVSGPVSGTVDLDSDAIYTFVGQSGDQVGSTVLDFGDLTGDGIDELAVGAATDVESVYVIEGGLAAGTYDPAAAAWLTLTSEERWSDLEGGAIVVTDYDGDGAVDLLVGDQEATSAAGDDSGVVYGLLGPFASGAASLSGADVRWEAAVDSLNLGCSLAAADIDGDAAIDVIMGAPSDAGTGHAYVQRGFTTGTIDATTLPAFTGPEALDNLGSSISVIPDWTGDGTPEIALGAPRVNDYAGEVYVYESDDLW